MSFTVINPEIEQAIWTNTGSLLVPTPAGDVSVANLNGTLTVDGGGISVNDFSDIIQIQFVNNFTDLQTALTNLSSAGGGKVIIAEGTFTVTVTLSIPANVIVQGSGVGATILQATNNLNAPLIQVNNNANVILKDLTLDGDATNQSSAFSVLDITGTSSRVLVKDCNLQGSFDNSSFLLSVGASTSEVYVSGCRFLQLVAPASAGSGVSLAGNNCILTDSFFSSNFTPVSISGDNNTVKGNIIDTFGSPLTVATGSDNVLVEANQLINQTASAAMISVENSTNRIQILNNILRTSAGAGVSLTGSVFQGLVEGNTITNTTGNVIDISALTNEFVAITKNNSQESLTDPATIAGTADRDLVETTGPVSTVLQDLNVDSAGHTVYIELNIDGGDLTLTATSADGFGSITFNDAGDFAILEWNGIAWFVLSSQGVIIDNTTIQANQQIAYGLNDLEYDGTNIVDFPEATLVLTTGNHIINYSVAFTTSDTAVVVNVFFRDNGTNTIIDESKTIFADSINEGRHTIAKAFVYTVASGTETLKLSYQLSGGSSTTPAVQLSLPENANSPNFDQAPVISSTFLDLATTQEVAYSGADLNYNGTTVVNVPGTITLTNGTWLVGYSVALRSPSTGDNVSVFLEDTGSTVVTDSKTFLTESTTTSRHTVSKYFLLTEGAGPTSYRIGFRTDTLADTSVAVEINTIGGSLVVPNQVVNLWAVDITSLTSTQDTYTVLTDINYNNSTFVDVPINITLATGGDYLVGYSLALKCPQNDIDPVLVTLRDNTTDDIFALGKTLITDNSTDTRHTISKVFLYRKTDSTSETLKLSFSLQNIADTSVALEMTPFTGIADPDQVPLLWSIRLSDVPSNLGTSFLDLIDTPQSYMGRSGKAVVVNPAETGLTFGDFFQAQVLDPSSITTTVVSFPAGFPATVNLSNPSTTRVGSVQDYNVTFILNTPTTPTNPLDLTYVFESSLPQVPSLVLPTDIQVVATGYAYSNLGSLLATNFVINNIIAFLNPANNNLRISFEHSGGTSGINQVITVKVRYFVE